MEGPRMEGRRKLLYEAIQVLTWPADAQIKWVANAHVDEIALNFNDIAVCALDMKDQGELTEEEATVVIELDRYLDSFSGIDNKYLWTKEALINASEWRRVRELAKMALALFSV